MNRQYITKHIVTITSMLLCITILSIYFVQPIVICNEDGSLKEFGIGYNNKTVVPMWYCTLLLAIVIYTLIRLYIIYPRVY